MQELVKVTLNNEMDLILAHKRSMKLAELAALSLSAQTTFATAVSEVSRNAIDHGKNGYLVLSISTDKREKYIVARITDEAHVTQKGNQGLEYAKRLVNKYNITTAGDQTSVELYYSIPSSEKLDIKKIDEWRNMFRNEPPISPYEEIKRKNEQLQELAQKLQESEGQYKTLTNALPIIIFSLNLQGQLIYANDWLYQFTGHTIEQLNETRWRDVVHPVDYDAFNLLFTHSIAAGAAVVKTQCRLRHKHDDDYCWHLAAISPLRDEKGTLLYWIGYLVDINAQKAIEETLQNNKELQQAQQQLKENQTVLEDNISALNRSNQELQQFAFIASHDLQEPIRKISFYSDYFLNKYVDRIDEKGKDYLKGMLSASHRMRNLIHDLLAFSQVEKKELEYRRIDLNRVISDTLQDLEMMIREKGAAIDIAPLPSIDADESMLRQLFANIISNSLKYAKKDQAPLIQVSNWRNDQYLEIAIKDNGIGFDEKYLPKMFTLFQRLHSGDKYKGTGLGLAICRKIVSLHNGAITASGKENEGATFKITLPLNQ
ncbi:PAS domain S-box protein [Chitinophaga agrisoli]|uniref:histidine kinase n=1 Tax=Chitinophaga agrisoli TaxID=2607653 RepID=A0A5B2VSS1_9BACT|nr:ATP-binding protein [Chitinophaga agrisoli]KAA2241342.1 PAS domain S-box protein [Chitinophaga agrisoli]